MKQIDINADKITLQNEINNQDINAKKKNGVNVSVLQQIVPFNQEKLQRSNSKITSRSQKENQNQSVNQADKINYNDSVKKATFTSDISNGKLKVNEYPSKFESNQNINIIKTSPKKIIIEPKRNNSANQHKILIEKNTKTLKEKIKFRINQRAITQGNESLSPNRPQYYQGLEQYKAYEDKMQKQTSSSFHDNFGARINSEGTLGKNDVSEQRKQEDIIDGLDLERFKAIKLLLISPRTYEAMKLVGCEKKDLIMKTKKKIKEESVLALKGLNTEDQKYYINLKQEKFGFRRQELIQQIIKERQKLIKEQEEKEDNQKSKFDSNEVSIYIDKRSQSFYINENTLHQRSKSFIEKSNLSVYKDLSFTIDKDQKYLEKLRIKKQKELDLAIQNELYIQKLEQDDIKIRDKQKNNEFMIQQEKEQKQQNEKIKQKEREDRRLILEELKQKEQFLMREKQLQLQYTQNEWNEMQQEQEKKIKQQIRNQKLEEIKRRNQENEYLKKEEYENKLKKMQEKDEKVKMQLEKIKNQRKAINEQYKISLEYRQMKVQEQYAMNVFNAKIKLEEKEQRLDFLMKDQDLQKKIESEYKKQVLLSRNIDQQGPLIDDEQKKQDLIQNLLDQEQILRKQSEKYKTDRFKKIKIDLEKQENFKFNKLLRNKQYKTIQDQIFNSNQKNKQQRSRINHEQQIWQDNIKRKQQQDLEEAQKKKDNLLKEHKRKFIEEKIQLELTQQKNKQIEQAKQAQKEKILKKIEDDNIRKLALEKYKFSLCEEKKRYREQIEKEREQLELHYETELFKINKENLRCSSVTPDKIESQKPKQRTNSFAATNLISILRNSLQNNIINKTVIVTSATPTRFVNNLKKFESKKPSYDSSIGISHEQFFPVQDFSSIKYVSEFNMLNEDQTQKFLVQLANLDFQLINQPNTLLKQIMEPLVMLAEVSEREVVELREKHNHMHLYE